MPARGRARSRSASCGARCRRGTTTRPSASRSSKATSRSLTSRLPPSRRGGRTVLSGPVINIDEGSYLSEYAVGKYGDIFPDGAGRVIRGGAKVRFNMHYHAVGKQTTATTSVGFVFYPRGEKPKRFITDVFPHENDTIDIPPGQMTRTAVYYPLPKAARLIGVEPP